MRRNQTLSNLSIAAIVMLFATIPALAQGTGSSADDKSALGTSGAALELALNRAPETTIARTGLLSVDHKNIIETAPVAATKPLSLSALKPSTETGLFVVNPFKATSETQFRTESNSGDTSKWGVSFVPSNGPKAPGVKAVRDLASKK